MKKFLMTAAAAMALTLPAWAQASLDADGDGAVTLEEIQAVNPDVTAEDFAAMDADGDGALNPDEVAAAEAAGTLPAAGGEVMTPEAPAE